MSCLLFLYLLRPVAAVVADGYRGYGLVGYGIAMYEPPCAYACHDSLSALSLACSDGDADSAASFTTSPDCYATDDAFLESVAYCMHTHCGEVAVQDLEYFWAVNMIGRMPGQTAPEVSYTEAFLRLNGTAPTAAASGEILQHASLVDPETYLANYNADSVFQDIEIKHSTYGLVLLATGAGIPIASSLLRFVPFPKLWVSKFRAWLVYPPVVGDRHRLPILHLGLMPTRGQGLFIAYMVAINIVLSCIGYRTAVPNAFYATPTIELLYYIGNRVGVLSFGNLALTVLYSGRNNVLLWVTDWSRSTYLLLHRWVAVIATLQACLHSAIFLQVYVSAGTYANQSVLPYWYWGIIATLLLSFQLPASVIPFRERLYEVFLACHFVIALVALVGCYLHIYERFANQWGYETWIYIAFAVWAFDWLIRGLQLAQNGVKTARITVLDADYLRIEIPGIAGSGDVYLYFPALSWRLWESHPFSAMAGGLCRPTTPTLAGDPSTTEAAVPGHRETKSPLPILATTSTDTWDGAKAAYGPVLTFFVRTRTGITSRLRDIKETPVLVEGFHGRSLAYDWRRELAANAHLVLIVGGSGISAVAPLIKEHEGPVRLYWGVRSAALAEAITAIMGPKLLSPEVVGEIATGGKRMNLKAILEREVVGDQPSPTAVVVCGPPSMADEARSIVSGLGRHKALIVTLVDRVFGW